MSLRQYLTSDELLTRRPSLTTVDTAVLEQAEKDIDLLVANFYQGAFRKASLGEFIYSNVILNNLTATITNINQTVGYYSYCVMEILSGTKAGKSFLIKANSANVITFFKSTSSVETVAVKVYQLGKFPMAKDTNYFGNTVYKTIAEDVKEAVAYQYEFRLNNKDGLNNKYAQTSYSVSGDSFSSNFDVNSPNSLKERLSPQASDLLGVYSIQTI